MSGAWDESEHPREPKGSEGGGRFTSSGGGSGLAGAAPVAELEPDEIEALGVYKNFGWDFNKQLREGRTTNLSYELDEGRVERLDLAAMDRAFNSGSRVLQEDVTVYRGLGPMRQSLPTVFVDNGWVSTTLDRTVAESYSRGGEILEIRVPKGTRVLQVKDYTADVESELILQRGTGFVKTSPRGLKVNTEYVFYNARLNPGSLVPEIAARMNQPPAGRKQSRRGPPRGK